MSKATNKSTIVLSLDFLGHEEIPNETTVIDTAKAAVKEWRKTPEENKENISAAEAVKEFLPHFKKHKDDLEKIASTLRDATLPLMEIVAKEYLLFAKTLTAAKARKIVRGRYQTALVAGGAAPRTAQRWLSAIKVDGVAVLTQPATTPATKTRAEVLQNVAKSIAERDEKFTLAELVSALVGEGVAVGDVQVLEAAILVAKGEGLLAAAAAATPAA